MVQLSSPGGKRTLGFVRRLGGHALLVAINAGPNHQHVQYPVSDLGWKDGRIVENILNGEEYLVSGEVLHLDLQPWQGCWIR